MAIQLNAIDIHKYLVLSVYYNYKHASFPVFFPCEKRLIHLSLVYLPGLGGPEFNPQNVHTQKES